MTKNFLSKLALSKDTFAESIDIDKIVKIHVKPGSTVTILHKMTVLVTEALNISQPTVASVYEQESMGDDNDT